LVVLQDGSTYLFDAVRNFDLDIAEYLVNKCNINVHAKRLAKDNSSNMMHTVFDEAIARKDKKVIDFLRPYMLPKLKMCALCMGLHDRLGADSPVNELNVDVMQEIAKHLPELNSLNYEEFSSDEEEQSVDDGAVAENEDFWESDGEGDDKSAELNWGE
jgi:hypothetical protein